MYDQGAQAPQFKFNNLFKEHFPKLFFSKVFYRGKTGKVEVDCYLKMVQSMVTLTNHVIVRAEFTLRGSLETLEIFATSFC